MSVTPVLEENKQEGLGVQRSPRLHGKFKAGLGSPVSNKKVLFSRACRYCVSILIALWVAMEQKGPRPGVGGRASWGRA